MGVGFSFVAGWRWLTLSFYSEAKVCPYSHPYIYTLFSTCVLIREFLKDCHWTEHPKVEMETAEEEEVDAKVDGETGSTTNLLQ